MNSIIKTTIITLAGATLFICGCTGNPISVKSVTAKDVVMASGRPITAEGCGFQLLLFIPIQVNTRMQRAFDELNQKAGSDMIANLSIEEDWTYGLLGTMYCTKLSATAYQKVGNKVTGQLNRPSF